MTDILTSPKSFLRDFMNALQNLQKFPCMSAFTESSCDRITIQGVEYAMKWANDEYLYLIKDGKSDPHVSATYLFQDDIDIYEEENGDEHWAGTTPKWLWVSIQEFVKGSDGQTERVLNHHLEDGKYSCRVDVW